MKKNISTSRIKHTQNKINPLKTKGSTFPCNVRKWLNLITANFFHINPQCVWVYVSLDLTSVNTLLPSSWEKYTFPCPYLQQDNSRSVFWHPKGGNTKAILQQTSILVGCAVSETHSSSGNSSLCGKAELVCHLWRLQSLHTPVSSLTCF